MVELVILISILLGQLFILGIAINILVRSVKNEQVLHEVLDNIRLITTYNNLQQPTTIYLV